MTAAMRPATITVSVIAPESTVFETVSATAKSEIQNATKLKNAAHITACSGDNTRVETMVAMELAES